MEGRAMRNAIQNILNRWSGLKLCVEHQSGGRQSKEKALYLIDYLHEVLLSNNKIETEDFEDLISDYMDNELQTILEDDSVREISKTILHLYDVYQAKGEEGLTEEMGRLPPCDFWLDITYPVPSKTYCEESSGDESESEAEDTANNQTEDMDCEWTEVSYRRKR
ncbi:UNVERIFIED_CONTAM: hypothetical protein PYX00_002118 [Menopon gallinae]|uniref:Pre-rRNA-processing protein TSR2 homolog n=1 Tax=Menopon gallinae TaxID=328185 RepID=A0AAW2IFB7_9NEOP